MEYGAVAMKGQGALTTRNITVQAAYHSQAWFCVDQSLLCLLLTSQAQVASQLL